MSLFAALALALVQAPTDAVWSPAGDRLLSRFAAEIDPAAPLPEYPRPQLVRERWSNLNGLWDFAVTRAPFERPAEWDGRILVPFPIESALSGVARRLAPEQRLVYRRTFDVPSDWRSQRVLLHFGAVDWSARVLVDGNLVGEHRGGYDPFTFDITEALATAAMHELVVEVEDPTDTGPQPRGKQVVQPGGIWYTPSSGIWQTVWLEPVPAQRLGQPHFDTQVGPTSTRLLCDVDVLGADGHVLSAEDLRAADLSIAVRVQAGNDGELLDSHVTEGGFASTTQTPRLWSPESPFLYDVELELRAGERVVDRVTSYVALREISLQMDPEGHQRLFLNGAPYFQLGLLDQGFWPGGLYTAPTDEALRSDLELTKRLGFNLARKHVKVEPDRWYYHADRLGVLVWQDLPSGDGFLGPSDPDLERSPASDAIFTREAEAIVSAKRNFGSIVTWVVFNEGWGQYDTARWAKRIQQLDPHRIVNATSGWADRGVGDVLDLHIYPGPGSADPGPDRAVVLGEFGGLGLPVAGHTWQAEANWGYRNFTDSEAATVAYEELMARLAPLVTGGLSAAVYTQTTDVEIEVNGLVTYDRAQIKLDPDRVRAANEAVFRAPKRLATLVPDARTTGDLAWRITGVEPAAGWLEAGFDDAGWLPALAGLGSSFTPGGEARTDWPGDALWARRDFTLDALPVFPADTQLALVIHYDEDAEVYLNGRLVASPRGYTTSYVLLPLAGDPRELLAAGRNQLAVHCTNTAGARYLDLGLALLFRE